MILQKRQFANDLCISRSDYSCLEGMVFKQRTLQRKPFGDGMCVEFDKSLSVDYCGKVSVQFLIPDRRQVTSGSIQLLKGRVLRSR